MNENPAFSDQMNSFISRHWFLLFSLAMAIYAGLPFLAPVFMHVGWSSAGSAIYSIYAWLCHQYPQRSFFLFGPRFTYSLAEVQHAWKNTLDPLVLRQFIGNPAMGWKVAWSDRMVSMYLSTWLFGLLWWPLRRRLKPLPWWGLFLFLVPMFIDGTTHFISDLVGIEQGFRDTNAWLAMLTHNAFPASFYIGTTWGSFNSLMRLFTGILFGLGVVWFAFPIMDKAFSEPALPGVRAATYHMPPGQGNPHLEEIR